MHVPAADELGIGGDTNLPGAIGCRTDISARVVSVMAIVVAGDRGVDAAGTRLHRIEPIVMVHEPALPEVAPVVANQSRVVVLDARIGNTDSDVLPAVSALPHVRRLHQGRFPLDLARALSLHIGHQAVIDARAVRAELPVGGDPVDGGREPR